MASHGIPRSQNLGNKSEAARRNEQDEIEKYKTLVNQVNEVLHQIGQKDFSSQSLGYTSKLLTWNPEYYTIWNHRRRILLHNFQGSSPKGVEATIASDLSFLLPLLIKYPKCYWIWNYRLWLLQQVAHHCPAEVAKKFWEQEIGLVGKMLSRDSRNFHGWSYRRLVISELCKFEVGQEVAHPQAGSQIDLTEQEFEYTTKMLRSNLSNFSAWHNRSQLIPRLLDARRADHLARRAMFDFEMSKVGEALSVDPYDQSLWFYHQWLIMELNSRTGSCFGAFEDLERGKFLRKEIDTSRELLDDFDDCKWIQNNLIELSLKLRELDGGDFVTQDELQTWLQQLIKLDPLRKGKWLDLSRRPTTDINN